MSERTEDITHPEYRWTDDVKKVEARQEQTADDPMPSPAASDPNHPAFRAYKDASGKEMPYNEWMENPFVQALSGGAKGVVRALGLEVHPSFGPDTPVEAKASSITKALHPGLDVPKLAVTSVLDASGQQLTPEQRRVQLEGLAGRATSFFPGSAAQGLWKGWDNTNKGIDVGKVIMED